MTRTINPILVLFGGLVHFTLSDMYAAEWTQYGGPTGQFGIAKEQPFPDWPDAGPIEIWSRPLGSGNSGIVTSPTTLYTQYRAQTIDGAPEGQERIIAVNKEDGSTRWEFQYDALPLSSQENYGGGNGPHATPLVVNDRLFSIGFTGLLHCLDANTGQLIWKKDLIADFQADPVQFGFSASPISLDALVIVQTAGPKSGITALRQSDGTIAWQSAPAKFSYATPVIIEWQGETQIVFQTGDTVEGIAADTGERRWQHRLRKPGLTNVPTPLWLGNGHLLIAGQGVGGTQLLQLQTKNNRTEIDSLWRSSRMSLFHSNWIQIDDGVFGGESFFFGMNWKRGRRAFNERGFADSNLVHLGHNQALILTKTGELILAQLDLSLLEIQSRTQLFEDDAWTPPTIVGSTAYIRNRQLLVALDLRPAESKAPPSATRSYRLLLREFKSQLAANNINAALSRLDSFSRQSSQPLSPAFIESFARDLFDQNRREDAIQLRQANVQRFPDNASTHATLGQAYLAAQNYDAAAAAFNRAIELNPENEEWALLVQQLSAGDLAEGGVLFRLTDYPNAKTVAVAGSFNGWNPAKNLMLRQAKEWQLRLPLAPGRYTYKFVVDGRWMTDPENSDQQDDGNGNQNSVITVQP